MRKAYLDNIRWATVLLVLAYHVCYVFNGVGILGGIPDAENIPLCDALAALVYPWFMVLLFAVAGMSARYALQKRTDRQFLKERARRCLVPSTLGLFVLHWITGYLNIRIGGGLAYIPAALVYPIAAVSGTGPLWFIQMLFVFSCVLVLLRRIDASERVWAWCGGVRAPGLVLLALPVYAAAQVFNLPVLTMYRFGIYGVSFLIGYYVFSHERVQEQIGRMCVPMLGLAVLTGVFYARAYCGSDYTSADCLQNPLTNLYLWSAVLAVIGCGRTYFNRETAATRYLARAGFGVYILHYPVLMLAGFGLTQYLDLPAAGNYVLALAAELFGSFAAYELIRRVPLVRFAVLGVKGRE